MHKCYSDYRRTIILYVKIVGHFSALSRLGLQEKLRAVFISWVPWVDQKARRGQTGGGHATGERLKVWGWVEVTMLVEVYLKMRKNGG